MDIKKILKNKITQLITFFVFIFFFFGFNNANAATLQINSNSNTISAGNIMTFSVGLNSEGVSVNNAEAKIIFPTDLFEVVSLSKSGSIFSLWVEEPAFSNTTGVITFNGGVPTPGFVGSNGKIISFVVKAKKAGQAEFIFSDAFVRANDGFGTDVLNKKQGKTISITSVVKEEEPVKIIPTTNVSNLSLQISSPTHPNEEDWYKENKPTYKWVVPTGADAVQTTIDKNASGVPRVIYTSTISEKTLKELEDGIWYFKARARKGGVWGPVDTYIIRIDTISPEKKSDTIFSYDDNSKVLNIKSDILDMTSGIDHYEIFINDNLVKTVPVKEFINGEYSMGIDAIGDNTVKLVAIDRAGNSLAESGAFYATGLSVPEIDEITSVITINERLVISGKTQNPDTDVYVNIRHEFDQSIIIKTKSNSDKSFVVIYSDLKTGNYEIWAETGSNNKKVSSVHLYVKATKDLLVKVGSLTMNGFYLFSSLVSIIILMILISYSLGSRNNRLKQRIKLKDVLIKGEHLKALSLFKRRLEKHLEILQNTRHVRVLTKEEKEIKEAIEEDLDEVDKIIDGQK